MSNKSYSIEILPCSNNWFWCILENHTDNHQTNVGHGYAETIFDALKNIDNYYNACLKNQNENGGNVI